ncbi:MAG: hypothetical protein FJ117_15675 [Deltaproteobacteria bacterium]|nr:hypothetical protein [Deltaproteobacteria bacterium]
MYFPLPNDPNEFFPFNLDPLFHPKSVAVIGASADLTRISGRPIKFLLNHSYGGRIFPVNPKYQEIAGLKCFSSIEEISEAIDVALIGLPAEVVPSTLAQCIKKGVKSAMIFSSGFAEIGEKGSKIQKELGEICRQSALPVCGPNCIGIVNLPERIPLSFTNVLEIEPVIPGNIGFISQSGALGGSLFSAAQEMGVGFSYWISSGNEEVLESTDFIHYMIQDPLTKVILGYIEGFRDLQKLRFVAREALQKRKPLVLLKVGKSDVGKKAAASHTGAMTGSDSLYDSLFNQIGILRVKDVDEIFDVGTLLGINRIPKGNGVGILTSSGGAGVLLADQCAEYGISVPELRGATREAMTNLLPPFGSALNPVDMTAQTSQRIFSDEPDLLKKYLGTLLDDESLHTILIMLTMYVGKRAEKVARDIVEVFHQTEKPLMVCWIAGSLAQEAYKILAKGGVPLFKNPGRCIRALNALVKYSQFLRTLS